MTKAKLEAQLTDNDRTALDSAVRVEKLLRAAVDDLTSLEEDLAHHKSLVTELRDIRATRHAYLESLGLLGNYRQRLYIEGLMRGL